jgi:ABC-type xylose transport system permease subunit
MIASACAASSGMITAARLGSALSNAGTGMEMNVIASCIIGGTSMFGGSGSILGTMIGALLMTTVTNAMAMLRVSVFLQKVVIGAIILIAVGIDQYNRKRSGLGN